MFKKLTLATLLLFSSLASSTVISLIPSETEVELGDNFYIDAIVSDIDGGLLRSYSVNLLYGFGDLKIIATGSDVGFDFFSNMIGGTPGSSLMANFSMPGSGSVDVASGLTDVVLQSLQPDAFLLFRVFFNATNLGMNQVQINVNALSGAGDPTPTDLLSGLTINQTSINVVSRATPVDAPNTGLLICLIVIGVWRKIRA